MADEKGAEQGKPSLASRLNAPPFVPGGKKGGGTSNVDAKPFTPGGGKTGGKPLGGDAKAFVPQQQNGGGKSRGIHAGAAAFVPGSGGPVRNAAMSSAAPSFVPAAPSETSASFVGGRAVRGLQRPDSRYGEGEDMSGYGGMPGDNRAGTAHLMQSPGPPPSPRPMPGHFPPAGANGYLGRGGAGRGRSPTQHPSPPPFPGGRGGRFPLGMPPPAGGRNPGRGRGMGHQAYQGPGGPQAGMGLLGRAYQNAAHTVDQLLPQLQTQAYLVQSQMPPEMQAESGFPAMVQQFHSLYPLEDLHSAEEAPSKAVGVQSLIIKGISSQDGHALALRKINWRQVAPSPELLAHANQAIEVWSLLAPHPNLSAPCVAFVSMEIGGQPCLYLGHEYHPAAATLEASHLQPQVTATGLVQVSVTEEVAWGYLMQLAAALRAVHSCGLACRASLHSSKVLLLPGSRIRIGSLGLAEILAGKAARQDDVAALQREDLQAVGRLLLQLVCGSAQHPSLEVCSNRFSQDLTQVIAALIGHTQEPIVNWQQLTAGLRDHSFAELDSRNMLCGMLTSRLGKEAENGRLLRLLVKLSTITERADMDTHWAETGDRYLLKLFRDFVFHQCDEAGAPILDWAHVVEALNKLDAGVPEKVVLMSRDEASMLVVSYADIRRCVEGTYNDLKKAAQAAQAHKRGLP